MNRTHCVRCGLPTDPDSPENLLNLRCTACSGELAPVWAPPESPEPHSHGRQRGRFSRTDSAHRASFPARVV